MKIARKSGLLFLPLLLLFLIRAITQQEVDSQYPVVKHMSHGWNMPFLYGNISESLELRVKFAESPHAPFRLSTE